MPSSQILYLMMFVGKCSCTSHVLQYSSSRSYEHSRSLQSSLCPGVVTVLICSFFVAASLNLHNFKNGGKITHFFTIYQTFLHFFCMFRRIGIDFYYSFIISMYLCTRSLRLSENRVMLASTLSSVSRLDKVKHQEQCPKGWLANRVWELRWGRYNVEVPVFISKVIVNFWLPYSFISFGAERYEPKKVSPPYQTIPREMT